jgi:anti-anti-sigma factor
MSSYPRPEFTITVHSHREVTHLRLIGELEYDTTTELLNTVKCLLAERDRLRHLHLDCAQLTFCDTVGLAALLSVRQNTETAGVTLHLDRPSDALRRLLELTGTLEHLTAAQPMSSPNHARTPGS